MQQSTEKQNADLAKAILQLSEELANITQETAELAAENKQLYMELDKVKLEKVYLEQQCGIISNSSARRW